MVELAEERSAAAWKIKNLRTTTGGWRGRRAGSTRYPGSAPSPRW